MSRSHTPEQLLEHVGWLRALARRLVRDQDLAEDLVQETLLTAVERPPDTPEATGSWLRTVLRNFAYRAHHESGRRLQRERQVAAPESHSVTPDRLLERVELQRRIVDIVLALGEPYRSTVLLRFFEKLSAHQIAMQQGVDVTTVRWRLRKALEKMRQQLDRDHGGRGAWCSMLLPLVRSPGSGESPMGTNGISGTFVAGVTAMKLKVAVIAVVLSLFAFGLTVHWWWRTPQEPSPPVDEVVTTVVEEPPSPAGALTPLPTVAAVSAEPEPGEELGSAPTEGGLSVAGLVLDAFTSDPLPGAIVEVRWTDHRATADEEGTYRLDGLTPGEHFLVASAEEYAESHARIRLVGGEEFFHDFSLEPAIDGLLTVVDEEGEPIEGVVVTRAQPAGDYLYTERYSRRTDIDGRALVPGISRRKPQQLHAKKEGYRETWWKDYRFDPDLDFAEGTIVLKQAPQLERVIAGQVWSDDGSPLAGASVQWIHSWGPTKGHEIATSGGHGRYRLSFQSDKETHKISVFASGHAPLIRRDVRTGTAENPARVDFTLGTGHWLEGRVADERGKPLEGVGVRAMPALGSLRNPNIQPGIVREATTDNAGLFTLEDLAGPTVAIRLIGPNGGDWANNVNEFVAVDTKVELTLKRWGVIRGRVIDAESGEPIPALRIQIEGGKGYLDYPRMNPGESFDAVDGRFVLERLDQDEYDLTVHGDSYLPKKLEKVAAKPADVAGEIEIRLSVGRLVDGVVIDSESGLALAEATVVFGVPKAGDLTWHGWNLEHMLNRQEVITGADGEFDFVEDVSGTLFIRAAGRARLAIPPADRGQYADGSGQLVVPLTAEAILSGVHTQEGRPCRTGFLIPVYLRESSGAGGEVSRQWLENLERDDGGRFRVDRLRPGAYWLDHYRETPQKVSAGMGTRRRLELAPGENVVDIGHDLGDLVIRGGLHEADDGKPVDGADLLLFPAFNWHYARFSARVDREHEGRFWIGGLRAGTYRVEVEGVDDQPVQLGTIDLTESMERDFVLPPPR